VGLQVGVVGAGGFGELSFGCESDGVVQVRNCLKGFVKWGKEGKGEGEGGEGERLLEEFWERCGNEEGEGGEGEGGEGEGEGGEGEGRVSSHSPQRGGEGSGSF
jgi:hypothetical protein